MRILKYELNKLIHFPLLWGLLFLFLAYNSFILYTKAGDSEFRSSVREMHEIIQSTGVDLETQKETLASMSESPKEAEAYYSSYAISFEDIYDTLNMQDIKQMKEDLQGFCPEGSYKTFLDHNYARLQQRVEEVRADGDDAVGFYPGNGYEIHKKLYSTLQLIIMELWILMGFSVLYLMDYERINGSTDLVFTSMEGRTNLLSKWLAGLLMGVLFSIILLAAALLIFFIFVPMEGLMHTPVSSYMVMESNILWTYPFITYVRLTFLQELLLSILTALLLTLLIGLLAGSLQLFFHNSYLTIISIGAGFLGLFALPFAYTSAIRPGGWLLTILQLNPVTMWNLCRRWFIEHNLSLSFAWSEFWTLGIWGIIILGIGIAGWRHLKRRDF